MRAIFFLTAALLHHVDGAAWRSQPRDISANVAEQGPHLVDSPRLEMRQATCPQPTTTVTTTRTSTRVTTVTVPTYTTSTLSTTKTYQITSTRTATTTTTLSTILINTKTYKTTSTETTTVTKSTYVTLSTVQTSKTTITQTATLYRTSTFTTTRTTDTTITKTATTCPVTTCVICPNLTTATTTSITTITEPTTTTTTTTTNAAPVTITTTIATTETPTSSSSTATTSCDYMAPKTRVDTASNGQQYTVNVDSFYLKQTVDRVGDIVYDISELDCVNYCESVPGCGYFVYSPNYEYCELYRDKIGGYCQAGSVDFISGVKITSTTGPATTSTSPPSSVATCNAVKDGSFEDVPQDSIGSVSSEYKTTGPWKLSGESSFARNGDRWSWSTSYGSQYLLFFGGNNAASASQDLAGLNLNGQYTLAYSYAVPVTTPDFEAFSARCHFTVSYAGVTIDSFPTPHLNSNTFFTRTNTFTPATSGGKLSFNFVCEAEEDFSDVMVDNVSLTKVGASC